MNPPRILVADDDPAIRQLVQIVVGRQGCECVAVPNGREALAALQRQEKFDVLLLDLMMPEVSGYDVIEHLRDDPRRPAVIVITASRDARKPLDPAVVTTILNKPFDIEIFVEVIGTVARGIAEGRNPSDAVLPQAC